MKILTVLQKSLGVRLFAGRLVALAVIPIAATCGGADSARLIDDAALANESEMQDWLGYGRTYSEQRFSPLAQINSSNVSDLA
ncbi:MAG: hypothetical protein GTO30_18670, partial [Acidobacteria bacterium]|nr:hypothetical protein [Acidobacteriota bacterium]